MASKFGPGIQDCPHCLARVVILSDGICPRCKENAADTSSVDVNRVPVWVAAGDTFPALCHKCGHPTNLSTKAWHAQAWDSKDDSPTGTQSVLAVITGVLFGWFWYFLIRRSSGANTSHKVESITLRLPQCETCGTDEVQPLAASLEDKAMKIPAHRLFVDEHQRLNHS